MQYLLGSRSSSMMAGSVLHLIRARSVGFKPGDFKIAQFQTREIEIGGHIQSR